MSQTPAPAPIAETTRTFDFDEAFGPVADALDVAMALCGIDLDEVEGDNVRAFQGLAGGARLQVCYATNRTIRNGFVDVANSTRLGNAQEAAGAMDVAAEAQASADATWQRLQHEANRVRGWSAEP